jgi:X-X-X-Leu-X-X-Gly heptad repeat protein
MATLLKPGGWTETADTIYQGAGTLAAGVQTLVSGLTKKNRDAIKAEREAQASGLNAYELAEQKQATKKIAIMTWVKTNWLWLSIGGVILLLIILWKPLMRAFGFGRNTSGSSRRPRRSVSKSVSRSIGRPKRARKSSSTFKRKIHGKTYTSAKSWAAEMRRLRKK